MDFHFTYKLGTVILLCLLERPQRFGLEWTFKDHLVQAHCHGQGLLLLDQIAISSIQPDFEGF